jgi:hypothetical protein
MRSSSRSARLASWRTIPFAQRTAIRADGEPAGRVAKTGTRSSEARHPACLACGCRETKANGSLWTASRIPARVINRRGRTSDEGRLALAPLALVPAIAMASNAILRRYPGRNGLIAMGRRSNDDGSRPNLTMRPNGHEADPDHPRAAEGARRTLVIGRPTDRQISFTLDGCRDTDFGRRGRSNYRRLPPRPRTTATIPGGGASATVTRTTCRTARGPNVVYSHYDAHLRHRNAADHEACRGPTGRVLFEGCCDPRRVTGRHEEQLPPPGEGPTPPPHFWGVGPLPTSMAAATASSRRIWNVGNQV